MKSLQATLESRFPAALSAKGNGVAFWLQNCRWDERHNEEAIQKDNLIPLIKLSIANGTPLLVESADQLLDELRARAKAAGDAKWVPDKEKKIIERDTLLAWWNTRTAELVDGARETSGGKLSAKLTEAGLSDDVIGLAIELRRDYAAETRAQRYLDTGNAERLRRRVRSDISSLRSRYIADLIEVNDLGFHALCLQRMDDITEELGHGGQDYAAFLKGCMFDIADRCLLRFTKRSL